MHNSVESADRCSFATGESGVDQLVEIIKVLGTPTKEEIHSMNPNYTQFKFPQIKAHPWTRVFNKRMPPDAVDLVSLLEPAPSRTQSSRLDLCAGLRAHTIHILMWMLRPLVNLSTSRPSYPPHNVPLFELPELCAASIRLILQA